MKHDGTKVLWHKELANTRLQITCIAPDAKGEILIADHRQPGGAFYTLVATPKDLPPSTFPKKLSESGLFRSVKGHVVEPALIPYSVNAPFWSDGVLKERWLAIPGDKPSIDMTRKGGWNFPNETVIVKSFAFEMEEGNPSSRRWIETRFLTKQGEWYGYSYEWNEEQTEATLVAGGGKDREFKIKVPKSKEYPEGVRTQAWHYPSRTECMVCHTRAANFVLGVSTEQMNKDHVYYPAPSGGEGRVRGLGIKDNQLRVLDHLGLIRINWRDDTREALRAEAKGQGLKTERDLEDYINKHLPARMKRDQAEKKELPFAAEKLPRLVNPYDKTQNLELRARSYLAANCAQCHQMSGGGNAAMELEFETPLDKMKTIDVPPLHHTFDLKDARLIAPGHPERSALLYRLTHRGPGQMPPLSTRMVDREAVEMLAEWIRNMKAK
jgi:mono/diheme cytochrome c family protein